MMIFFNRNLQRLFLGALFLTFFLPSGAFCSTPDPTEQLKPFLEKLVAELKTDEFKQDTSCHQCKRIVDLASEHFDFYEMSRRVMGKQWRTLSTEQKDKFVSLFTKLLQYAYIGKVEDYVDKKIEFKGQRVKGKRAEVKTLLVDTDKTIPVSYIMLLKDDKWMAYDIVVENVSLVRNYMEQIRSILRSKKFPGLITQLEKKIKTLEEQKNKKHANAGQQASSVPSAESSETHKL
ncbi:MAG: hypothetical protein DSY70_08945 [Desulfobulbus sp.]|nr:MAG: hypothetical protein DSY70_08945 [Desulfobulbus sp.]